MMQELKACLNYWTEHNLSYLKAVRELYPAEIARERERDDYAITMKMAREAEAHLAYLAGDNSEKAPEELEQIASSLSPGGTHNGGELVRIILANVWSADPLLVAATVYFNWDGGKAGFQFLPDPATTNPDE